MHIVDATMFYADQSGGVKRYLSAKQAWLATQPAIRHTVLVPGPADMPPTSGMSTVATRLTLPFSGGYRCPLSKRGWQRSLRELAPDLIEVADPYRVAWAVLDASRERGTPAIAFHHSDIPRLISAQLGHWAGGPVRRYLRHLYSHFDLVLTPSEVMVKMLTDSGVPRVRLQPLGVDIDVFHPARRDPGLRAELGLPPQTRLLVFAGRFSPEKHVPELIAAFRRLGEPYHLLLVGGRHRGRIEPNVTQLPYEGGGAALARLVASCDALAHAGDAETFGLVIAEAMACGLPVLGVDAGAVPELVDAEVGLLVPSPKAADLAAGITALYARDLPALGAAARRRIEARYSWPRVLTGLTEHYEGLLGRSAPPATLRRADRAIA